MTTFWKPFASSDAWTTKEDRLKRLGGNTYILWCRCDVCFGSGRSGEFHFLQRGEEHGEMCDNCYSNREALQELWADGWTPR
jgi:hypothetical protein